MTQLLKNLSLLLTFYFCQMTLFGQTTQQNKIDSLLTLLKTSREDTTKVNTLNKLFLEVEYTDTVKAKEYLNKALELALKIIPETKGSKGLADTYENSGRFEMNNGNYPEALKNYFASLKIREIIGDKQKIAASYNNIGVVYYYQSHYPEAVNFFFAALKIWEELGNKKDIASSYNNIGNVYQSQGNYPEALTNHFASLKIKEAIGDSKGIAASNNNIGNVYQSQGNYIEALKNHFVALKIRKAIGDKQGIAYSYNGIGVAYITQGNYPLAIKNYFDCLKIMEAIGDKKGIAASYNNIGNAYKSQENYHEALKNHFAALKIREEMEDKGGIAGTYLNIGDIYTIQKKYYEGEEYLIKAIKLSKEIGYKECLKNAFGLFTELDSTKGNFKGAYENHKLYILYRDSLDNEETRKKTIQSQMTYDFEKKEAATKAEQDKKDILAKEELKQKEQQRNYFIIGFALVGLLASFILRGYKQKQKANLIITQQKAEVEKSKHIIEEKNKDITDSITYAKRIQRAMLPHRREIWAAFPNSFVLFKPKDIVSGDFYFFTPSPSGRTGEGLIAVCDCTGHGVPGAFMSMIGAGKLNDAVAESSDPSEILSSLNKGIKAALKQSDDEASTRDGMDIALCSVDPESSTISYAGANRPLWIIRNGSREVEEIKATKNAIGGLTSVDQHFESHEIQLQAGDTFYITTDGYADQFSGKTGKKLMTKKFKEILVEIQDKPMKAQEQHLDNYIESWKTGTEQVDDILVIGVRI